MKKSEAYIRNAQITGRREIIAVILFLVLVLALWLGLSALPGPRLEQVPITDGAIDLLRFDFENNIQVVKEFENYESWPQALYTPEDFERGVPAEPQVLGWPDYKRVDDLQYATHRLTLLMPPGKIYAITMKTADYGQRLFIDGKDVGNVGIPAVTVEEYVPGTRYRTYFFMPQSERVEIIFHTANYVHGKSGCEPPEPVMLGSAENINTQNQRDIFFIALIIGCLLTSFLYHLSLFLLNRRRYATLMFSVCCLLLALMEKRLLFAVLPDISWYAEQRFEYLVHFLTFASIVWFIYWQFPGRLHKAAVYFYCAFSLLYCLTVAFDTRFFTGALVYYMGVSFAAICYILVRFAMSLREKKLTNTLGFAGIAVLGLFAIRDMLYNRLIAEMFSMHDQLYTAPVGMVFFVFCYALLIAIEYAETQRRERFLEENNELLTRLNRNKTEFLQDMSHELKTPLTVMAAGIDYADKQITRESGSLPEASGALGKIRNETQRLGRMVAGMVELASISDTGLNRKRTDLAQLLRNSAEIFQPAAARKNNTLRVAIAPDMPDAFIESDQLTQVVTNVLSNAMEHTENGGIVLSADFDRSYITVRVKDSGAGIRPDIISRVFERGVSGRGGTGYGLYICKTVVEAHGGAINITSEPGRGTELTFTVPVYAGQEAGHSK